MTVKVYVKLNKKVKASELEEELKKAIELAKEIGIPGTIVRVENADAQEEKK